MMKFSFWNRNGCCWSYRVVFCDYFYVFVSSNAVYRFEGRGTSWNRVHNAANSEYYFWSLAQPRILEIR